jgi:hypothetical protein
MEFCVWLMNFIAFRLLESLIRFCKPIDITVSVGCFNCNKTTFYSQLRDSAEIILIIIKSKVLRKWRIVQFFFCTGTVVLKYCTQSKTNLNINYYDYYYHYRNNLGFVNVTCFWSEREKLPSSGLELHQNISAAMALAAENYTWSMLWIIVSVSKHRISSGEWWILGRETPQSAQHQRFSEDIRSRFLGNR